MNNIQICSIFWIPRDRIMRVLVQSIYTFISHLTYAPAPYSCVLIPSSKSSILLEFMKSWNLTLKLYYIDFQSFQTNLLLFKVLVIYNSILHISHNPIPQRCLWTYSKLLIMRAYVSVIQKRKHPSPEPALSYLCSSKDIKK